MRTLILAIFGLIFCTLGCDFKLPWNKAPHYPIVHWMEWKYLNRETASFIVALAPKWTISRAYYHNIGNAYFISGQLPEAILAYNRGLYLDPNDSGLRDNLDYARAQVQYPSDTRGRPEVESWPAWLYQPSSFQVLAVTLAFYFLTCVLITRWFMTRRRALLFRAAVVFLLAVACGFLWLSLENNREWRLEHPLVVIHEDKLPFRKGNGPSYPVNPDMPLLAHGMEARKIHERADWLQIQFASGEVGWVEKKSVLVDEP